MTTPEPAPVEAQASILIDEIIAMYHTTRLAGTPVAAHILSKARVQNAFATFERDTLARHRLTPRQDGLREAAIKLLEACEYEANANGGDFGPLIGPPAHALEAALSDISPLANDTGALREALGHDAAVDAICGAISVTVLSYQEAIEGYLDLRGLAHIYKEAGNGSRS